MGGASAGGNNSGDRDTYNPVTGKQNSKPKKNPVAKYVERGGAIGSIVKAFKEGAKKSKQNVIDYEGQAAGVTPMRAPFNNKERDERGGNNNKKPVQTVVPTIIKKTAGGQTVKTTAPTEAEISQSAAADAEAYDLRKTKKRGRSMTILTSSKGIKSIDDKLTLGKPSLLGS